MNMRNKILVCMFLLVLPGSSPGGQPRIQTIEPPAPSVQRTQPAEVEPTARPEDRQPAAVSPSRIPKNQPPTGPVRPAPKAVEQLRVRKLPDLSIVRFSIVPLTIVSGEKVTLEAEVENSGTAPMPNVLVRFMQGAKKLGEQRGTIAARGSSRMRIAVPVSGSGLQRLTALVDPDKRINESDESNNSVIEKLRITAPAGSSPVISMTGGSQRPVASAGTPVSGALQLKPDLLPVALSLNKSELYVGESVVVRAALKNFGGEAVTDVPVDLTVNGNQVARQAVSIPPNYTESVIFRYKALKSGEYLAKVIVDPEDGVAERNESNNSAESGFRVDQPELAAGKGRQRSSGVLQKKDVEAGVGLRPAAPAADMPRPGRLEVAAPAESTASNPLVVGSKGGAGVTVAEISGEKLVPMAAAIDLSAEVVTVNGVVPINKNERKLLIKLVNSGAQYTDACIVGLGISGQAKIGSAGSWLDTIKLNSGAIPPGGWIYGTFMLPASVNENTNLVAAVDIGQMVSENDETNNYTKAFKIALQEETPVPTMPEVDLRVEVETVNGVYQGDGLTLRLKVSNVGSKKSGPFTVGYRSAKQDGNPYASTWLATAEVPGIHGGQHLIVPLHWSVDAKVMGLDQFVGVADIHDVIDEGAQAHEDNNSSKPFGYQEVAVPKMPGVPLSKETYLVTQPGIGDSYKAGADVAVLFYLSQDVLKLPPQQQDEYTVLDIDLMDDATKKKVAGLAEEVPKKAVSYQSLWMVTLPSVIPDGDYYLLLQSRSGKGHGTSKKFRIFNPKMAGFIDPALVPKKTSGPIAAGPAAIDKDKVKLKKEPGTTRLTTFDAKVNFVHVNKLEPRTLTSLDLVFDMVADTDFSLTQSSSVSGSVSHYRPRFKVIFSWMQILSGSPTYPQGYEVVKEIVFEPGDPSVHLPFDKIFAKGPHHFEGIIGFDYGRLGQELPNPLVPYAVHKKNSDGPGSPRIEKWTLSVGPVVIELLDDNGTVISGIVTSKIYWNDSPLKYVWLP